MACRKGELREEGKNRNDAAAAAAATSVALGDALLFTTMCIIGMAVEVHAKDGSVYSGIFYTASVDKDYAIVLKKARMIKMGNLDANVVNGTLMETLIVRSEDLVQVVAKGVLLPSNGITGHSGGDGIEAAAGYDECLDRDAEAVKPNESKGSKKYKSQSRFSVKREHDFPYSSTAKAAAGSNSEGYIERLDAMNIVKIEEAHNVSVDGRHFGDGSQEIQFDLQNNLEFQDNRTSDEVRGSSASSEFPSCSLLNKFDKITPLWTASITKRAFKVTSDANISAKVVDKFKSSTSEYCDTEEDKVTSSEAESTAARHILEDDMHQDSEGVSSGSNALEDQDQERATLDETACTVASPPNIYVASTPISDVKSESCLSASSNPFLLVPPKSSSVKRTAKESKLNPGAKMFSPSMLHHRTVTPAVPNGASDSYMPGTYTMMPMATAQEEVDGSSFARSSVPVKFVPYNNVAFGHGGNDAPYVQPIIGQVVNRTQPVRYTGQYQNFQTGHTYVHPNPQNVMFGRVGPLVCMHPVSSDAVQGAAGFSPAATRPVLTPHQVHLPKHQGNASAQALQLRMTPPIIANGPQPFVIPSSIPISQPLFPVLQPIAVPGINGYLSTKFA